MIEEERQPWNRGVTRPTKRPPEYGRCTCGGIVIYRGRGKPPMQCDACRKEAVLARTRTRRDRKRMGAA